MPASYPGTRRTFATKINVTEVVDAGHVNDLQDEVAAIQTYVGVNPHVSTAHAGSSLGGWSPLSRTYASLSDRIANVEAGLTADTHTQYARLTGNDTFTGTKTFASTETFFGPAGAGTDPATVYISAGSGGGTSSLTFRDGTTQRWSLRRTAGDPALYLRDIVNGRNQVAFTPGATVTAATTTVDSSLAVLGNLSVAGTSSFTGAATFDALTAGTVTATTAFLLPTTGGVAATAVTPGDAAAVGTSRTAARADHLHAVPAWGGTPAASPVGGASATGTTSTIARGDHAHALAAGSPVDLAGDSTRADGTSTAAARADHVHGMPGFGALLPATLDRNGGAAGTATTLARSDHKHGLSTAAPVASAPGDVGATSAGGSPSVAAADHVHAREAFATTLAAVDAATANAGGAGTVARGDHKHAATVGPVLPAITFGIASADGTSTALSRADHSHGTPPAPTPASVGAVNRAGDTMTGALTVPSPLGVGDGTLAKAAGGAFTLSSALSLPSLTATGNVSGAQVLEGAVRVYSPNNPQPVPSSVTIMPFFIGGSIGTGLRRPKIIATVPMRVRGAYSMADFGSGTYEVFVNGVRVSGTHAFGITAAFADFADFDLNPGDRLQLNVASATADAADLSVTLDTVTR